MRRFRRLTRDAANAC